MSKTEKHNDVAAMFTRLPGADLRRLSDLISAELDKRGKKPDLGSMNDREFQAFVSEQFRKADQAAREADLRSQLSGKDKSSKDESNKPTTKDQKEIEIE